MVWSMFMLSLSSVLTFSRGVSNSDDKCIAKEVGSSSIYKLQYCMVTGRSLKLSCPKQEKIVLSSLQFAIKSSDICSKRVLDPENEFCCTIQENDVFYDAHCLHGIWNKEDQIHYAKLITQVLRKCTNSSKCVLNSEMFSYLQKRIPSSKKYSSYFQILHRCIKAPASTVDLCSSKSVSGKEVHVQGSFYSNTNRTCTCVVTSRKGGNVTVRAVDVRTANNEFILSSNVISKNMSQSHMPSFGFTTMITGKSIRLTVKFGSANTSGNLWLQISESKGRDVKTSCGESTMYIRSTPVPTVKELSVTKDTVFLGYWPLIYIAAGSVFTMTIVVLILGAICICRKCKRKRGHRHLCGHPLNHPDDLHHDPYTSTFATELNDTARLRGSKLDPNLYDQAFDLYQTSTMGVRTTNIQNVRSSRTYGSGKTIDDTSPPNKTQRKECYMTQLEAFLQC